MRICILSNMPQVHNEQTMQYNIFYIYIGNLYLHLTIHAHKHNKHAVQI